MMQINRTGNADIISLSRGLRLDGSVRPGAKGARALSVETDTAGYVGKALSLSSEPGASRISEARAFLAGGGGESPAAIREAAGNLVTLGI